MTREQRPAGNQCPPDYLALKWAPHYCDNVDDDELPLSSGFRLERRFFETRQSLTKCAQLLRKTLLLKHRRASTN